MEPISEMVQLQKFANHIRRHVLNMLRDSKASHIGGNFSCVELLTVLYNRILQIQPDRPSWEHRDRFILSKGHAVAALYATLAERGFCPVKRLETFYQNGSTLTGHATHTAMPGIEVSTGSLGHGLSLATGMALAAKRDKKDFRVFCMISDGECDEGSTWEPILFAPQHHLDNLIVLVDYNNIQSLGCVKEVMDLDPLAEKFRSFRWSTREIDGHDIEQIYDALLHVPFEQGKPSCIIAHTVKGKGVSFMENSLLWHYRAPQGEEYAAALAELEKNS